MGRIFWIVSNSVLLKMNDIYSGNFRPFPAELARVAGWHDGVRVHIADPGNPHVILHEDVHTDILRNTPDGQFLSFCILFNAKSTGQEALLQNRLMAEHIDESRTAHECFATFIGANLFEEEAKRIVARSELNPEYKKYYDTLDAITSEFCKSMFLKVALSTAIQQVVFSSPALYEWSMNGFDFYSLNSFSPSQRLLQFNAWWHSDGLTASRKFAAQSLVEDPQILAWANKWGKELTVFEAIDDDSRILADKKFAVHLESWLITHLIEMFTSDVPIEMISTEQWRQALEFVVAEAEIRDVSLILDSGDEDNRASEYRMIEVASTQTYIDPRLKGELVDMRGTEFRELASFLRSPKHIVGFLFDSDKQGLLRCKVDVGELHMEKETGNPYVQFHSCYLSELDIVSETLFEHVQAVTEEREQLNPGCIVTSSVWQHITHVLGERIISENHCHYLKVDLFDFILINKSNYQFGFQKFEAPTQPVMTAVWGRSNSQSPAFILKCIPEESGRLLFAHLARNTDIDLVDDEAPPMIVEAIRLVTSYWSIL